MDRAIARRNRAAYLLIEDPALVKKIQELLPSGFEGYSATLSDLTRLNASDAPVAAVWVAQTACLRQGAGDFLAWLADPARHCPGLLLAGLEDAEMASGFIAAGCELYLRSPLTDPELRVMLERLAQTAGRPESAAVLPGEALALTSPAMRAVYGRIQSVAPLEALNILLMGETGTGKQEVARLVHRYSKRYQGPFVEIDCAALPLSLVESELFGHEAGAFTDARARQLGLFDAAQGGTLFLDEVGELPLETQAKLLRAIELRRFRRVGGREELPLDVRIVSATNRDLAEAVRQGRFRSDLYYRLNGIDLWLPPLRERFEDLEDLARGFWSHACALLKRREHPLSRDNLDALRGHLWPGNIRELKSAMLRIAALAPPNRGLDSRFIEAELGRLTLNGVKADAAPEVPSLRQMEEQVARQALEASGGNKTAAAKIIGVSKPTFFRMLKRFGIRSLLLFVSLCYF